MVAKNVTVRAAENIDLALQEFVQHRAESKVLVFADDWGNLHAIVATSAFEGMSDEKRQEHVWAYLRDHIAPDELAGLYRLYALTGQEYDACYQRIVAPGSISEELDLGRLKKDATNEGNGS